MANVLKVEQQKLCLKMLVEGSSIRAVERTTGVHRDTIMRLMVRFGKGCQTVLDQSLHHLNLRHVELDEQWTWVAKKNANCSDAEKASGVVGDQYLFVALDQDTKLIAVHSIGKRTEETTRKFVAKLAARMVLPESGCPIEARPQISTDGWQSYPPAILDTFDSMVQYGVIVKRYENEAMGRYAPPDVVASDRRSIQLIDDLKTICTSHVERFNCTTRQFVKRFCRLTLCFSKKLENLEAAVAMHIANYNFCWRSRLPGKTGKRRPPAAMLAGVTPRLWSFDDLYEAAM